MNERCERQHEGIKSTVDIVGSCKGNTITCSKDAVKLPIWRGYSFFCVAGAEQDYF